MYYNQSAGTADTYKFIFLLARPLTGAKFQVYDTYNSTKTLVATITVPNTGGWQAWRDVAASIYLKAGSHALTVYSVATPRFNVNYFKYGRITTTTSTMLADTENAAI